MFMLRESAVLNETRGLLKASSEDRRFGVGRKAKAIGEARGQGHHVLEAAAELNAQDVAGGAHGKVLGIQQVPKRKALLFVGASQGRLSVV